MPITETEKDQIIKILKALGQAEIPIINTAKYDETTPQTLIGKLGHITFENFQGGYWIASGISSDIKIEIEGAILQHDWSYHIHRQDALNEFAEAIRSII